MNMRIRLLALLTRRRITLTVAMETMNFIIVQFRLTLKTKIICISGVPMNYLTSMKNCPCVQGRSNELLGY